jgi:hypothetical protein
VWRSNLETTLVVAIGDDRDELIVRVDVDPAAHGVFDHVLQTAHIAFDASRLS